MMSLLKEFNPPWFINKILKRKKKVVESVKKIGIFWTATKFCLFISKRNYFFLLSLCQFQVVKFLVESWMVVAPKPQETKIIAETGNAGKVRKRRKEGRTRKKIEDDLQMMVQQVNKEKTAWDVKYVCHVLCFNITFLKVSFYQLHIFILNF